MKKKVYLIIALALILSSFSIFGVAFMDHDVNQKCPLAFLSGTTCEVVAGAGASVFHHISAYQSLTEALVSSGASVLVALMFAVTLLFIGSLNSPRTDSNETCEHLRVQERVSISILNPILIWTVLYNKRNSHLDFSRVAA